MKPAREPASSRPKPCASLKKPPESSGGKLSKKLGGNMLAVETKTLHGIKRVPQGKHIDRVNIYTVAKKGHQNHNQGS